MVLQFSFTAYCMWTRWNVNSSQYYCIIFYHKNKPKHRQRHRTNLITFNSPVFLSYLKQQLAVYFHGPVVWMWLHSWVNSNSEVSMDWSCFFFPYDLSFLTLPEPSDIVATVISFFEDKVIMMTGWLCMYCITHAGWVPPSKRHSITQGDAHFSVLITYSCFPLM